MQIRKKRKNKISLREKNIKITTLMGYWAKCIKVRDKKCVYCGNTNISELEAHHIKKRVHSAVKFDLKDGVALCKFMKGCNGHWRAEHEYEMKQWIKDYIGKEVYDDLDRKACEIKKWTPLEKRDLLNYFKEYLKENGDGKE